MDTRDRIGEADAQMRATLDVADRLVDTPNFHAVQRRITQTIAPQMAGMAAQISRSIAPNIADGLVTSPAIQEINRSLAQSFVVPQYVSDIAARLAPTRTFAMPSGVGTAQATTVEQMVAPRMTHVAARLSQSISPNLSRLWRSIQSQGLSSWLLSFGGGKTQAILERAWASIIPIWRWIRQLPQRAKVSGHGYQQLTEGAHTLRKRVRRLSAEDVGVRERLCCQQRVGPPPGHVVAQCPQLTRGPNRRLITYLDHPAGVSLRAA